MRVRDAIGFVADERIYIEREDLIPGTSGFREDGVELMVGIDLQRENGGGGARGGSRSAYLNEI